MAARDEFITVNGIRTHYTEFGEPTLPPLICLHGFMGTGHNWDTFASRVSHRFHVLAPTARGHGDSARPENYDDMFAPVHDVAALMDALDLPSAMVMGHSMGALVGAGVAVFHPDKVSKLVMGDAGPDSDPEGAERLYRIMCDWQQEFGTTEEVAGFIRDHFEDLREDEVRRWASYGVSYDPDGKYRMKLDPALVRARVDQGPNVLPPGENPLWQFVPQTKCPTLIVRGVRTIFLPRASADRMVAEMPDARLVEMDSGHLLWMENPEGFYEAVRAFIGL